MDEPCPSDDMVPEYPNIQDAQVIAYFLHVQATEPASNPVIPCGEGRREERGEG